MENGIILEPGDIVEMKKSHPCGSRMWKVISTGVDIKMVCEGCGREIVKQRFQVGKTIKNIKKSC